MSGCHYDYIDFSITIGNETGTPASNRAIRTWMQYLSDYMGTLDFIHSKPDTKWIREFPKNLVVSGLSASGGDFIAYLADARELSDPTAGSPIEGSLSLSLPPGTYDVSLYSRDKLPRCSCQSSEGGKTRSTL